MVLESLGWGAAMLAALAGAWRRKLQDEGARDMAARGNYRPKPLLEDRAARFMALLEEALPECRILAKVPLDELMEPQESRSADGLAYWAQKGKARHFVAEYVIQRRSDSKILALAALGDRSGRSGQCEALAARAGYATLRWGQRNLPAAAEVRQAAQSLESWKQGPK